MSLLAGCSNATTIEFAKDTYVIAIGEELEPEVNIRPKNAEFDFLTSNPTILSLQYRTFLGIKEGATEITIASGDKTDTAIVVVLKEQVPPIKPPEVGNKDYCLVAFLTEWSSIPSQTVRYGSIISEPTGYQVPSGYVLDGFYLDKEFTQTFNFENPIYADTYIYIKWQVTNPEFVYSLANGQIKIEGLKFPLIPYTKIVIPSTIGVTTVTEIGDNFLNSKNNKAKLSVEEITIPDTVTTIGKDAFLGCSKLSKVTIEGDNIRKIKSGAFAKCVALVSISLPNSITTLESMAFADSSKLATVNIPNKLTTLADEVFRGTALKSVSLKNIEVLGFGVFLNCKSLEIVTDYQTVAATDYPKIQEIGARCFEGTKWFNAQITQKLPVEEQKYKGGVYLDKILLFASFNASNLTIAVRPETTYIANGAVVADKGYLEFEAAKPCRVEERFVSKDANGKEPSISSTMYIVIKDTQAYEYAMREQATRLYVADNLGVEGLEAFIAFNDRLKCVIRKYNGTAENITISIENKNVSSINTGAFNALEKLKSVTIKCSNLYEIQANAFNRCIVMNNFTIISLGNPPTISPISFNIMDAAFKAYVPSSLLEQYKTAWGNKETRLAPIV